MMIPVALGYMNPNVPVVIAASATSSAPITTNGMSLCGAKMPATFTGTAITFEMCDTVGGTYVPVIKGGTPLSYAVLASQYIVIDSNDFKGIMFLKIKSNATEAAQRTMVCSLKGI